MPNLVHQSQIPLLPIFYHAKRLVASPRPLSQPSALINSKVGLIRTDITKLVLPNGAIVNAANNGLLNGGGVCGAIHNAAGGELLVECIQLNGCDTGDAKITRAYNLPCKSVIHGVGPIYWQARRTNEHSSLLSSCYTACLKLAVENGLDTIAFPAVSTGIYGYPSYEAAETAISTVRRFLETKAGEKLKLVIFCNFEVKDEVAYLELLP
jgi:O-acetyl-ADP-ribose deacetylase (regulator of RNase III)